MLESQSRKPKRSATAYPLRFYAEPRKLIMLFLVMVAVYAGCALALRISDPTPSAIQRAAIILLMVFTGFGAIAYLILIALFVIGRRPLLEIDSQGWIYRNPFTLSAHLITWDNIASVSLATYKPYRGLPQRYILIQARDNIHTAKMLIAHSLLARGDAPFAVHLTYFERWMDQAAADLMFRRILDGCAADIRAHHVPVFQQPPKPSRQQRGSTKTRQ
ncbi:MAG TPA: hypothetical protein VF808_10545 [Ktedonobacterales bacterium]